MNLEAEERNGYFVSHETKKVWDIQLKMVKKLLEVCKNIISKFGQIVVR